MGHVLILPPECISGGRWGWRRRARGLKHDSVERVTLVDIDEAVIETSRACFPSVNCALDHLRLRYVHGRPGLCKGHVDEFNVIVVDTDPVDLLGYMKGPFCHRRQCTPK